MVGVESRSTEASQPWMIAKTMFNSIHIKKTKKKDQSSQSVITTSVITEKANMSYVHETVVEVQTQ